MNAIDLVKFVLSGEEGFFGDELEENATKAPNIHFLIIIAIGHEALGSPVPACGDVVGVGGRAVFSLAGTQIRQFYAVPLDENVFGFDVTMKYSLFMHELDGLEDLKHVVLDFLVGEGTFFAFEALVEVHVHEFENEGEFAWIREGVPLGSS